MVQEGARRCPRMRAATLALCASLLLTGCLADFRTSVEEKFSGCGERVDVERTLTAAEAVDLSYGKGCRLMCESD